MAATGPLVLGACLATVPLFLMEISNVEVYGLGQKRAGTNCPIRPLTGFIFPMAFIED